jgi:dTDP-4-dehydrorhamnose reductase
MSNVLVTGARGQLGREIKKLRNHFSQVYTFTDIEELDVTRPEEFDQYLASGNFKFVINCAAYTNVDKAEEEPDMAMLLNRDAVGHLVKAAEGYPELRIIHISTDYIFGGDRVKPIQEDDAASPLSVYGTTKYEGEKLLHGHPRAMVIRTSWLFSVFGKNFVKSMINRMDTYDDVKVVYDQIGTPTYAEDLARAIMQIISVVDSGEKEFVPGIYNYSNEGVCSWYDLAMEVCSQIKCRRGVLPVESRDYPLPARRPLYSVLNKSKIKEVYGVVVPYWRTSLEKCIKNLL